MPLKLKQLTFQAQQKKKRKHSFLMMKIKRATTMWIQAWKEFKMQQAQQQGNERLLTWWARVFFNIFLLVAMLGAQFPKAHLCSCILDAPTALYAINNEAETNQAKRLTRKSKLKNMPHQTALHWSILTWSWSWKTMLSSSFYLQQLLLHLLLPKNSIARINLANCLAHWQTVIAKLGTIYPLVKKTLVS